MENQIQSDPVIHRNVTSATTPPVLEPKKPNVLPILLGALSVIALATAGYFFYQNQQLTAQLTSPTLTPQQNKNSASPSPSTNITANWKEISSEHWQFKVPTNWNYLKCSPELLFVGPSIAQDSTQECAFDGSPGVVQVSRILSINKPWPYPIPTEDSIEPSVTNRSTIEVNGKTATIQVETYHEGQGQGTRWMVYVPHSSDSLDIITLHDASQKTTTFDHILSTFTFTDENSEQSASTRPVTITVPADWKPQTVTDSAFGLTTTLTLPPDYTFYFSGSETTLNSSDQTDSWDHFSPLTMESNLYDGSSRRAWYAKFLEGNDYYKGYSNAQIVSVKDIPINNTSYLAVTIKWDLGTETHYLIVNQGIMHIFRPLSDDAKKNNTFFSQNAATILSTLKSTWTKPTPQP